MQYEIKYKFEGGIGTYYMPLITEQDILAEDIKYSARLAVAEFLGTNQFKILSINACMYVIIIRLDNSLVTH